MTTLYSAYIVLGVLSHLLAPSYVAALLSAGSLNCPNCPPPPLPLRYGRFYSSAKLDSPLVALAGFVFLVFVHNALLICVIFGLSHLWTIVGHVCGSQDRIQCVWAIAIELVLPFNILFMFSYRIQYTRHMFVSAVRSIL